MKISKYFKFSNYYTAAFIHLAKLLKPHLARTPLIWGDSSRLSVGKNVHLVDAIINLRSGKVIIEDEVFFGHGVMLLTGKHALNKTRKERHEAVVEEGRDIVIRRGAWIASGAIIIGPCEIGENAVIGAGSVASGFIQPDSIYTGNPTKFVRKIDSETN